jgi:hypothetical protein
VKAPPRRGDDEPRPKTAERSREHGDQNAERCGQNGSFEPAGPEPQADARLEGCSESRGDNGTRMRPLLQSRERWTICGPTHQT